MDYFSDKRISPSQPDYYKKRASEITKKIKTPKIENEKKLSTLAKISISLAAVIFVSSCIVLTVLLVIYGAFPCSIAKCDPNAVCVNRPFYADCMCNYGYAGNGLECDECGNFQSNLVNTIQLSQVADPHSWPATADIIFSYRTNYNIDSEQYLASDFSNCGGTIINRKTILTTASCIKDKFNFLIKNSTRSIPVELNTYHETFESMYTVYVAVVKQIGFFINIAPARSFDVEKIIKHELYDPKTLDNDIAIIKLEDRLELDDKIKLSCLPSPNEDLTNFPTKHEYAWGAGWGSSGFTFNSRPGFNGIDLKNFRLNIYNNSMCYNITRVPINQMDNDVFCAGEYNVVFSNNRTGSCHGDFGGSLYTRQNVSGVEKFVTTGLLSYNEGCNIQHSPGIYTNVIKYLEWIRLNSNY